jgi:hypothetical protein
VNTCREPLPAAAATAALAEEATMQAAKIRDALTLETLKNGKAEIGFDFLISASQHFSV